MYGIDPKEEQEFLGQLKFRLNNIGAKVLYLCVSGSHLYGFNSENSDIDYRGCFQLKTNQFLTTRIPKSHYSLYKMNDGRWLTSVKQGEEDDVKIDAVTQELVKEVGILLGGNCNFNEHLASPPIITSPEHVRLKQIIGNNLNISGLYHSYRGMAEHDRKKFLYGEMASPKKFLYVFRGLLAAWYVMKNNKIESNIERLNDSFNSPIIAELIDLKRRGLEKGMVNNASRYLEEVDKMFTLVDEEAKKMAPRNIKQEEELREKVDQWMHDTRLSYLDHGNQS